MKTKFTVADIPEMAGKTVLVTGGNGGIGREITRTLRSKGANVIITSRTPQDGAETVDLASLESVKAFTARFDAPKLDVLICNAGVMNIPTRTLTADGFETHFGTNHLGHFALTLGLLPLLRKSPAPRVVMQSALVAYNGVFDFDNLQSEKKYSPMGAYSQSKLANVLFANELGRREPGIISVAVQPGSAMTGLQRHTPKSMMGAAKFLMKFAGQPVEDCALPALYAAAMPSVKTGQFFGPTGALNKGGAGERKMPERAVETDTARRLWEVSEQLTGVRYGK
jgi:NAD(P)-dependent dehydrogenase (short-subunit alcohol dehydrogenase family)